MEKHHAAEDTTVGESPPLSRSTARRAQTPRATRSVDQRSRPGTLPPVPGRLRRARPLLWPLTFGFVLAVLTEQVLVDGPLLAVDRATKRWVDGFVAGHDPHWMDRLTEHWSNLGEAGYGVPVLAVAAALAAWRLRTWRPLLAALVAGLLLFVTVIPGKILIGRPGPLGDPVPDGGWGWFPSGHTATSAICFGTAALLLARAWPRLRWLLYGTCSVVCLGVVIGLLWHDYHWLLDILASWSLTGLVLWTVQRMMPLEAGTQVEKSPSQGPEKPSRSG